MCAFLGFLFSLGLIVGCGSKKTASAEVSGKVTYKGAPVTGGLLAFHGDAGGYSAAITPDGTYHVVDLPPGEVVVTVDTESINPNVKQETYTGQSSGGAPGGMGGMYGKKPATSAPPPSSKLAKQEKSPAGESAGAGGGESGQYVKIPRLYADRTKSPLKVTIQPGNQEHNFEVKD